MAGSWIQKKDGVLILCNLHIQISCQITWETNFRVGSKFWLSDARLVHLGPSPAVIPSTVRPILLFLCFDLYYQSNENGFDGGCAASRERALYPSNEAHIAHCI